MKIFYRFFLYGFIGICLEILWTGLDSLLKCDFSLMGRTSIWMIFIYGLALFLEPFHDILKKYNFVIRGIIYMILIFEVEYLSGSLLRYFLGVCPWQYDYYSLNGLITLYYIPVWFLLGFLFEKIHYILDSKNIKTKNNLKIKNTTNSIIKRNQL